MVGLAGLAGLLALLSAAPATGLPGRDVAARAPAVAAVDQVALTSLNASPAALNRPATAAQHDYVVRCPSNGSTTVAGTVTAGGRARTVPLGPTAGLPSTTGSSFSATLSPPGVTAVRIEVLGVGSVAPVSTYRVRCLPSDFPTFTTTVTGAPRAAYYVVTHTNWDIVLDATGTPVWWLRESGAPVDAKIIDGRPVTTVPGGDYMFRAWDGTPTRVVSHGLDHHDLQVMPDGDLVGFQYYDSDRGLAEEARFLRLDATGQEVWSWRTQDHIDAAEMAPDAYKLVWGHANSVEPDGDDRLLVSIRNLDAIYDIDMTSGAVSWKLGGTTTPQSLTVSDGQRVWTEAEVLRIFSGQHDARILADGTVSVFDNGSRALSRRPRVMRFRIDLATRQATLLETLTDPRAGYSFGLGSARRTEGGGWVVNWGGWNDFIAEYGPDGQPVLTVSGVSTYRAVPVAAGEIDPEAMRAGMDAMAGSPRGVTGSVADEATGAPVPWAGVALLRADDLTLAKAVVADAEGDFAATVAPGTYLLYLLDGRGDHRPGFFGPPTPVVVTDGRTTDVRPTMTPTRGSVAGRVTDSTTGGGVSGAWAVTLNSTTGAPGPAVRTDASGHFALDGLPEGPHKLVVVDPTGTHAPRFFPGAPDPGAATTFAVAAGATTTADVALPPQPTSPPDARIDGTVTAAGTGRPQAGVLVLAVRAADYAMAGGDLTDASGAYDLPVVHGDYKLIFLDTTGAHAMEWYDDLPYHGIGEAVTVSAPATVDEALEPTTGAMQGRITDTTSASPLGGSWVVAIGPTGPAGGAITAPDGTYTITGLRPGTYRASAIDPDGGHGQRYWADAPDFGGASAFTITAGATTAISMALPAG